MAEEIVHRIDAKLKEKNLKRAAMYETCNLSSTSMTYWEKRGTVPAGDKLVSIAEFLDVELYWLITGKANPFLNREPEKKITPISEIGDLLEGQSDRLVYEVIGFIKSQLLNESAKNLNEENIG